MARSAIIHIGQLLTMAGADGPKRGKQMQELGCILDGAVIFDGPVVEAVGTTDSLQTELGTIHTLVDFEGKGVVSPGFVDAHTHIPFSMHRADEFGMRCQGATYQDIAEAGGGIKKSIRQTAECVDLLDRGLRQLSWCHGQGTVCIEAKSGYGGTFEHEQKQLRVIQSLISHQSQIALFPTYLCLHSVPPGWSHERHVRQVLDHDLGAMAQEVPFCAVDLFVEEGYFSQDEARGLASKATALGKAMRMHVDQFGDHGGAALAVELGAQSADHLEFTGEAGIRALAGSNTMAGLLPASVHGLSRCKYPDARAMLDAGVAVFLASDFNPGSSPTPSLPFVMHLAMLHMGMTAEEVWNATTWNAAYSLGVESLFGSVKPGASGALLFWDLDDYREVPYWISALQPVRVDELIHSL